MRKLFLLAVSSVIALVSRGGLDESLTVPDAQMFLHVGGKLNVVFQRNATTEAYAVFTAGSVESNIAFDVQVKPVGAADEDANWTTVNGSIARYNGGKSTEQRDGAIYFFWSGALTLGANSTLRARIRIIRAGDEKEGAYSAWKVFGDVESVSELTGDTLCDTSDQFYRNNLTDGDLNTFYEGGTQTGGQNAWSGIDFRSNVQVTRVRLVHRYATMTYRVNGAEVQVADNPEFANPTTLYAIHGNDSVYAIHDIVLPEPAVGRYFRILSPSYCNFSEAQWIGDKLLEAPVVSAGEGLDLQAHISSTDVALGSYETVDVERSYSPKGPFERIIAGIPSAASIAVVDGVSGVGLPCYYRLVGCKGGMSLPGGVSTAFVRVRQLERVETDQTCFAEGVTLLKEGILQGVDSLGGNIGIETAFDGDVSDGSTPNRFSAKGDAVNPVIGVRLPSPAHLVNVRACVDTRNSTRQTRAREMIICGSTTFEALGEGEYVVLSQKKGNILNSSHNGQWVDYASTDGETPYECVFACGADGYPWCGHVRELQFIGWTLADEIASGKVFAPEDIATTVSGKEITLAWKQAVNATTIRIERRNAGTSEWATVAESVDPAGLSFVDKVPRGNTAYEYRLIAIGLGGMMSVESEVVTVTSGRSGMVISLR